MKKRTYTLVSGTQSNSKASSHLLTNLKICLSLHERMISIKFTHKAIGYSASTRCFAGRQICIELSFDTLHINQGS